MFHALCVFGRVVVGQTDREKQTFASRTRAELFGRLAFAWNQ
jgi:hypothetical protein